MSTLQHYESKEFTTHPLLARLLALDQVPKKIYIRGELKKFSEDSLGRLTPRVLTIVGSRKHSEYGRIVLEKILKGLQGEDIIIVSGLALGIDSIAHKEALKNGLVTWAVPGSGIDDSVIYPARHKELAHEILSANGCLLGELEPETKPSTWTFPARNRIMAALSDAVLIVEAEEKSGTLITARLALELGRDIGAIPGEILSPTSSGTNKLIRDGAYCITDAQDIIDLLHIERKNSLKETTLDISPEEKIILDLLREPQEKDLLLKNSRLPLSSFLTILSSLEMKGYIQETFGEVRKVV
jgi:DNA processing protein